MTAGTLPWVRTLSRGAEGPGPVTLRQPTERHGGNARTDEEVVMETTSKRHYLRPEPDASDVELETWAEEFVIGILDALTDLSANPEI